MAHYKTSELLNDSNLSKFSTKKIGLGKWFVKKSIFCQQKYKVWTSLLRSNLCD